jgi:hypothetical protein
MDYPTPSSIPRTNRFMSSAPIAIPRRRNYSPAAMSPRRRAQSPDLLFPMSPETSDYPVFSPEDEDEKPLLYPFPSFAHLLTSHAQTTRYASSRSGPSCIDENSSDGRHSPKPASYSKNPYAYLRHEYKTLTPRDQNTPPVKRTPTVQRGFKPMISTAVPDVDYDSMAGSSSRPRLPPPSRRPSFTSSPWVHIGSGSSNTDYYMDGGLSVEPDAIGLDFGQFLMRRMDERCPARFHEVKAARPAGTIPA